MKRALLIAVLGVCLLVADPLAADQDSPALDDLFQRLASTSSPAEASEIEREIWRIWGLPDDRSASGPFALGVLLMSQGAYPDARRQFDMVVAIAPGFAEGWNKRATVFYMMGDYEASVRDIQRTLSLEPRHFGALSGLSLIHEILGREETALDILTQVKEIYPKMPGINERMKKLRDTLADRKT